jgi:hypothetical protein
MAYNQDPEHWSLKEMELPLRKYKGDVGYIQLPTDGQYGVPYGSAEVGSMSFDDFHQRLVTDRGAYLSEAAWMAEAQASIVLSSSSTDTIREDRLRHRRTR